MKFIASSYLYFCIYIHTYHISKSSIIIFYLTNTSGFFSPIKWLWKICSFETLFKILKYIYLTHSFRYLHRIPFEIQVSLNEVHFVYLKTSHLLNILKIAIVHYFILYTQQLFIFIDKIYLVILFFFVYVSCNFLLFLSGLTIKHKFSFYWKILWIINSFGNILILIYSNQNIGQF